MCWVKSWYREGWGITHLMLRTPNQVNFPQGLNELNIFYHLFVGLSIELQLSKRMMQRKWWITTAAATTT
jgi:hypothetical protein